MLSLGRKKLSLAQRHESFVSIASLSPTATRGRRRISDEGKSNDDEGKKRRRRARRHGRTGVEDGPRGLERHLLHRGRARAG